MYNYDNFIFNTINKLWDCLVVSLLWLVSSLPIVTLGASTTALYYAINKAVRQNEGKVWQAYWHAFKDNFKQSTVIMLLYTAILAAIGGLSFGAYHWIGDPSARVFVLTFLAVIAGTLMMIELFTLAYTARFSFPTKRIIKNGALINLLNMQWGIVLFFVLIVALLLCIFVPLISFTMPGFVAWIAASFLEKVFRKYMSPKDLEEENNAAQI